MNASAEGAVLSFLDTNVLVYAFDISDPQRSRLANQLMERLMDENALCTSSQVLGEFFTTSTRKLRVPLSPAEALKAIDGIAAWPVLATDYRLVRDACELSISAKVSYWDALIICAALRSGATKLYSEDLNDGQRFLGVEIVNPFRG